MNTVFIGIGSNLGDRENNIKRAICEMSKSDLIKIEAISELYKSKAQINDNSDDHPDYLNGVIKISTTLLPNELLGLLIGIEKSLGRPYPREKNLPRTIDLDILLYNDEIIDNDFLKVPHPLMVERFFVLKPFADIAPLVLHPVEHKTIAKLLSELDMV